MQSQPEIQPAAAITPRIIDGKILALLRQASPHLSIRFLSPSGKSLEISEVLASRVHLRSLQND
jgi:hypothetical protein